jgi:hypothetical protein
MRPGETVLEFLSILLKDSYSFGKSLVNVAVTRVAWFSFRQLFRLTLLKFFVLFLSPPRKTPGEHFN